MGQNKTRGIKLEVQYPSDIALVAGRWLSPFPLAPSVVAHPERRRMVPMGKGGHFFLLVNLEQEEHRYVDSVCFGYEAKTTETEYSDALRTFYLL